MWDERKAQRSQRAMTSRRARRQKALEMFRREYDMGPLELPPGPVHNHAPTQTFRSHQGNFVREG